jgi:5-methylcytosine-specific restriction endonuclease McrA
MSERLGCSVGQVQYWCNKFGLATKWKMRKEENAVLAKERKKKCSSCDGIKPLTDFDKDPRFSNGSSQCKECRKPAIKQWKKANRDRTRLASNGWKERNPEKVKEYSARYYAENKEERKSKYREWHRRNPRMHSRYGAIRAARVANADGHHTYQQLLDRIAYYGSSCWICKGPFEAVDHVKPISKGGSNWPANLRPICTSCNSRKRDKWPLV